MLRHTGLRALLALTVGVCLGATACSPAPGEQPPASGSAGSGVAGAASGGGGDGAGSGATGGGAGDAGQKGGPTPGGDGIAVDCAGSTLVNGTNSAFGGSDGRTLLIVGGGTMARTVTTTVPGLP